MLPAECAARRCRRPSTIAEPGCTGWGSRGPPDSLALEASGEKVNEKVLDGAHGQEILLSDGRQRREWVPADVARGPLFNGRHTVGRHVCATIHGEHVNHGSASGEGFCETGRSKQAAAGPSRSDARHRLAVAHPRIPTETPGRVKSRSLQTVSMTRADSVQQLIRRCRRADPAGHGAMPR